MLLFLDFFDVVVFDVAVFILDIVISVDVDFAVEVVVSGDGSSYITLF